MNTPDKNNTMTTPEAEQLAESVAARIDESVSSDVAARLRAARQEAVFVAERKTRSANRWLGTFAPLAGTAAACAIVIVALNSSVEPSIPVLDDAEMAAAADMDFLEELEMLAWMDEAALDAG